MLPLLRRLQRPRQQARGRRTQCILAGASWPSPASSRDDSAAIPGERRRRAGAAQPLLRSLLSEELASAVRVRSRGLHRLPPRLALECVAVSAQSKTEALLAALHRTVAQQQEDLASEAGAAEAACVMVFANTNASAVFVSAFLREALADGRLDQAGAADWTIAAVHGHLGPAEREAQFASTMPPPSTQAGHWAPCGRHDWDYLWLISVCAWAVLRAICPSLRSLANIICRPGCDGCGVRDRGSQAR